MVVVPGLSSLLIKVMEKGVFDEQNPCTLCAHEEPWSTMCAGLSLFLYHNKGAMLMEGKLDVHRGLTPTLTKSLCFARGNLVVPEARN